MELVTGRAGSPHITSQQDRQKHQGIWGDGAYILATGNMLEPEVQSSNKILIKDGALMFQGALFTVKVGTTDEITINNGNQGMQRKDLVVARYKYDSSQNIESAEWVVIQGTPAASNPVAPGGTSGDIQAGDSTVDCPFMVVNLDGINVTGVDIIPEKIPTLPDLIGKLPEENDNYIKFPDGTVIQWGNVQSPANSQGYNTVTFPVPFKDTSYRMQATPRYGTSSYPTFDVSTQVVNESRAYVYFRQTTNVGSVITGVNADWMAIGRWK